MTSFIHPCYGCRLTSKFGPRTHPVTGKPHTPHKGVDFAKVGNIPILAAASGTVMEAREIGTYGYAIVIQHNINGKRMDSVYAHMRKGLEVKKGDKVRQGQRIGFMGNTGMSTGQHLHFELHNGAWTTGQPNAIDPLPYITGNKVIAAIPAKKEGKTLTLPKTVNSWAVYPTNKQPVKVNAIGCLNPKKFGGLSYKILANPQKDVYTIQTSNFGKVNIYAAPTTGAIIK